MKEAKISPLGIVDAIGCSWSKLTYDTPLSDVPIIGLKSSLNPLGSFYRKRCNLPELKEAEKDRLLPMSPQDGPPLPRLLGLKWPWKKEI